MCVSECTCRFYLERLARTEENIGRLLFIGDGGDEPKRENREPFKLIWIDAVYPNAFIGFGDDRANASKNSYLLKYQQTGRCCIKKNPWLKNVFCSRSIERYEIFAPKRWTHLCLSYEQSESFIIIAKVFFRKFNCSTLVIALPSCTNITILYSK